MNEETKSQMEPVEAGSVSNDGLGRVDERMNMEWQPIDTAPKTGQIILVAEPGHFVGLSVPHIHMAVWVDEPNGCCWKEVVRPLLTSNPTRWMPLPEPPAV